MSAREPAGRRRRASTRPRASPVADEPAGDGVGFMGYLRAVFRGDDDSELEALEEMAGDEPPVRRRREGPRARRRRASEAPPTSHRRASRQRPGPDAARSQSVRGRLDDDDEVPRGPPQARQGGYLGPVDARAILGRVGGSRVAPSPLFLEELQYEEDDYPEAVGPEDGGGARSPPKVEVLEGRVPGPELRAAFPLDRLAPQVAVWDESVRSALALGHPAGFYPCPDSAFGLSRVGVMHFASPDNPAVFFRQTLQQGEALAWYITGDGILDLTDRRTKTSPAQAMSFLADAVVRLAINGWVCGTRLHAEARGSDLDDRAAELRRQFASLTALRPVGAAAVPLLSAGGLVSPQSGPDAAVFRSSLGSLLYWPGVRALLDRDCRVAARYAGRMTYLATGALLARFNPDAVRCVLTREAAFLGRVLDVLAVMAEQTVQWLSVVVGARLHPHVHHPAFADVAREELFRALPLGSPAVVGAEHEALGDTAARRLLANSGLNAVLGAAVYALHTALATVTLKYARACGDAHRRRDDAAATRAILAAGLVLQRLLGFADTVVACVTLAAFDGGFTAPEVGTYTPPALRVCPPSDPAPVRAHHPRQVLGGRPRGRGARGSAPRLLSAPGPRVRDGRPRLSAQGPGALPPAPVSGGSVLGPRVRVVDIMSQFRKLLMGDEGAAALRAHVSGRRATGLGGPPRP
ncbi:Tegument protein UL47 [Human alphaherpesvirus 1 strain 17]|uniref:Tegument protein UL47 n=1 Tax=Human herpesvirus 1 (strain 17) TaxID=10299 RepID=A0A181ZHV9_HHV11|nr:Tegument protein UL47 [Human alphaherpesvirus 1 strain 17]